MTTVNGKIAKPGTIIRNGDRIQCVESNHTSYPGPEILIQWGRNMVHRHEPPITSTPIEILVTTPDYIIINKPGSIVCHTLSSVFPLFNCQYSLYTPRVDFINIVWSISLDNDLA